MNFCNELALANANDVILKFEVIISCRAVNISSFIFINAQALCTSTSSLMNQTLFLRRALIDWRL